MDENATSSIPDTSLSQVEPPDTSGIQVPMRPPEAAPKTPELLKAPIEFDPSRAVLAPDQNVPPALLARPPEPKVDTTPPPLLARPKETDFDPTKAVPAEEAQQVVARNEINEFLAGQRKMTPEQFKVANDLAEGNTYAATRAIKGVWGIGTGMGKKAADLLFSPEERAHAAEWIGTRAQELVEPYIDAGHELGKGNILEASKAWATGEAKALKNIGVGITGGTAGMVSTAAGLAQGAHNLQDELSGVNLVKRIAGIDDTTEKYLSASLQNKINSATDELYKTTDTSPDNVFTEMGAIVPWIALSEVTGVGGLTGMAGRLGEMAPGALQKGVAIGGKVAEPVVRHGTPLAGGAVAGAALGHPILGAVGAEVAQKVAGALLPKALAVNKWMAWPSRMVHAMGDWQADQIGKLVDLASTAGRPGQAWMEALSERFAGEAEKSAKVASDLRAGAEASDVIKYLNPDNSWKIDPSTLAPKARESFLKSIPKDINAIVDVADEAKALQAKAALSNKFLTANKIMSSAIRGATTTAATIGEAGLVGGTLAGAEAAPGDIERMQEGANSLALMAAPFAPLSAVSSLRGARMADAARHLMSTGKGNLFGDISSLPQEWKDYTQRVAGMAKPLGAKVILHTEEAARVEQGLSGGQSPGNGWVDNDGNIHLVTERIGSGVAGHEFTHATQGFFGEMLRKLAPDKMQEFEAKYGEALARTGQTKFNSRAERDAEAGRFVLQNTPMEMFLGGERGGDILKRWVGNLLGEGQTMTIPGFNAPVTRADIANMKQRFFKAGELAARAEAGPTGPPPVPRAEVLQQKVQDYVDRGMPEDEAVQKVAAELSPQESVVSPETGETYQRPGGRQGPPVGGITQQFMPEIAPQTEEFKRWSGDAPVVLDAGVREPSRDQLGLRMENAVGGGYNITDGQGNKIEGPIAHIQLASDTMFHIQQKLMQERLSQENAGKFKSGQPVVVGAYHGTPSGQFHVFDENKLGTYTGAPSASEGFFFSGLPDTARAYKARSKVPVEGYKGLSSGEQYALVSKIMDAADHYNYTENPMWRMEYHWAKEGKQNVQKWAVMNDLGERITSNLTQDAAEAMINDHNSALPPRLNVDQFIEKFPHKVKTLAEDLTGKEFDMTPAEGGHMHEVYVKFQNPFVYDFRGNPYREESYYNLLKQAKAQGHDGAIFTNTYDGGGKPDNIFVSFKNKNIKSTENVGTFDPHDADIRYMPQPDNPDAIKGAAIKLPDGRILTGAWHGVIDKQVPPEFKGKGIDGFVTGNDRFLTRDEAWVVGKRFGQIPKYARPLNRNEIREGKQLRPQLISEDIRPPAYMPDVGDFQKLAKDAGYEFQGDLDGVLFWKNPDTGKEITAEPWRGRANAIADFKDKIAGKYEAGQDLFKTARAQAYGPYGERNRLKLEGEEGGREEPKRVYGSLGVRKDGPEYYVTDRTGKKESGPFKTQDAAYDEIKRMKGVGPRGYAYDFMEGGQFMPEVNVGMHVGGEEKLTTKDIADALEAVPGVKVLKLSEQRKEGLEPTTVATLSRALTPKEGDAVSRALDQESIAQHQVGGQGDLFGPQAEKWGPFNPDYFVGHDGRQLTDTLKDYYAAHPKRTGASGIWDRMTVDPNFMEGEFEHAAEATGANPKERFYRQTPAAQKAIQDYFMGRGEAQFMPNPHPEAIKEAAIQTEDGKIYSGRFHGDAIDNAMKTVGRSNLGEYSVGFVTNEGEFLNRKDSLDRAVKLRQIPYRIAKRELETQKQMGISPQSRGLESYRFDVSNQPGYSHDLQFMPSTHPDAIVEAAVKTKDGKILTGPFHSVITDIPRKGDTDGFVTKTGRFLNRREAWNWAQEIGQAPSGMAALNDTAFVRARRPELEADEFAKEKYFMPEVSLEELHRQQQDAFQRGDQKKLAELAKAVNEWQKKHPAGGAPDKFQGSTEGFQFMPSPHPEAVKEAAVQMKDGKVFTGPLHSHALERAREYYGSQGTKAMNRFLKWEDDSRYTDGYVNNKGDFLNREQAYDTARRLEQIPEHWQHSPLAQPYEMGPSLESTMFEDMRRFMPNPHPDAIKEPAFRTPDGEVIHAPVGYHSLIPLTRDQKLQLGKLEPGFISNKHTDERPDFMNRKQALERARERNQLSFSGKMGWSDSSIEGGLHTPDVKEGSTPPWSYMPSPHPEAIQSAAWKRSEDGKVITGTSHPTISDEYGAFPRGASIAGFVTKTGKFLDRNEAADHAALIGQALMPQHGYLESMSFNADRRFMPDVPSDAHLRDALSENKIPLIGAHRDLPKGTPVSLRIDIPAYNKTGDYAVTVHDRNIGKVHGYDGIATVDNPTFYVQEKGAQKVKEGMAKYPMAAVNGEFNPSRAIPKDINDYAKVGFNPVRHSYFYDKSTGDPVISGDKAISAGNTVYVKNPVYGNPAGFLYMPDMPTAIDRAALRNKETGEIITGGQNDTHFMIPASSGKADDYLGPNGHKIYEEGFVSQAGYWYDREQAHTQMKALGQLPLNYQGEYKDELNVTDLRKGRQAQMMPDNGFIGHVTDEGNIEGEKAQLGTGGAQHEKLGYNDFQWRYNPETKSAYWWGKPEQAEKDALKEWLGRRGQDVEKHVTLSTEELGPMGFSKAFGEAHGMDLGKTVPQDMGVHGNRFTAGTDLSKYDQGMFMPNTPEEAHAQTAAEAAKYPEAKPLRWKLDEAGQPAMIYDKKTKKTTAKPLEEGYNLAKQYLAEQAAEGKSKLEAHAAKIKVAKDKLKEFYDVAKANPEAMQANGWYRELKEKLLDKLGGNDEDLILFTRLLATTSPNTNPGVNFGFALDAWNRFQKGEYKNVIDKYNQALTDFYAGKLKHANGKPVEGLKQFAGYLYGNDIIPYATGYHEKGPQKGDPKKLGMHSLRVLDTISDHYDRINGLKINQFAHNLAQTDLKSTIDLWAARTLHRLLNDGNKEPWRILPMNEKGISEADFHFAQEAFGKAAEELKVSPDDLQAILWFAEKIHYDKQGWSTYLDKGDFRPLVERMVPDIAPKTFRLADVAPPQ